MNKLKFEHKDLKRIFGEKTEYVEIDDIGGMLNKNTKIAVVSQIEGKIVEYNWITLKDYLDMIDNYYNPNKKEYENEISIRSLKFSTLTENALRRTGISYVSQLEHLTEKQLRRAEGIGDKSISDIKLRLNEAGKSLKDE